MADLEIDLQHPVELPAEEDEQTWAAIDRGIRDADAGQLTSLQEVEEIIRDFRR